MAFKLGTYRGIPVGVSGGWLLNAAFLLAFGTWVATPEVGPGRALAIAAGVVLGAALSLLGHETGYAVAAHRHGVRVDAMVLTAGGAHVQLANGPPSPRAEFWICAAGPVAGLAMLMLVLVGIDVLAEPGKFAALVHLELYHATDVLAAELLFVNACSVLLSALPGLPLDGGGMLHAVLWHRTGDRVGALEIPTWLGQVIGVAIAAAGVWALSWIPPLGVLLLLFGAYLPAVDADGRYLGLVHRRELLLAIDTGPPPAVGRLVTPPERDALAEVVAPAAPLDSVAVMRAIARRGVAVAVDERRRFHGIVTPASWQAALAEAARRRTQTI